MNRRNWLKKAGGWILGIGLLAPFYSFIKAQRYHPPKIIRVRKKMSRGEHVVDEDFVLFITGDGPLAVSRHCTHLGCIITYHQEGRFFLCPCHQSRFTWNGKYISGPAKKDLKRFVVKDLKDGGYAVEIPRGQV